MKPPEILLVNDEPVQRYRMASILRKEGYRVVEAEDGLMALEQIENGLKPSLVIVDLYMPRLDGWQLCREIRERGLDIPLLVVSAFFTYKEITNLLKALGVNDFLPSPVKKEDLVEKVRNLLAGRSVLQEKEVLPLLFASSASFPREQLLQYLQQTGFQVTEVDSFEEAQEALRQRDFHLAVFTSEFSPDDILELRQISPHTSFIVLLLPDSLTSPFVFVLKGARHVIHWPGEPEYLHYLCQREMQEKALLIGQELLRTKTKELEKVSEELQRIQKVLQIVVEQAAEMGIVVTNEKMEPFFANPKAQELFRISETGDFQGFLKTILGEVDREEILRVVTHEGRYACEVQVPRGKEIFLLTVKPLLHQERVAGLVFFVQDVTQEREWQKKLVQIQKMEAIATLAAGIAHDFNNLLAAIRLKAELLSSKLQNGYRHYVSDIIAICDRAAQVVKQIISFSRPVHPSALANLNVQVREAINFLKETIPRGIRVQLELTEHPLLVHLDAGQLSQVIMNVCLNAVQAMGDTGTLTIQTGEGEFKDYQPEGYMVGPSEVLNGRFAWVKISDTGCGISPEVLPRIFDPYFTTKEGQSGTGLGLAMTYGIVTQADGKIAVETTPKKGTTFTIYLPLVERIEFEDLLPFPAPKMSKAQILIIEDEEMIRDSMAEYLEGQGYEVHTCEDGQEALAILKRGYHPDVVVIDLNMPGLPGVEIAKIIKESYAEVAILIATGKVDANEYERLRKMGVDMILIKPFSLHQFHDTLCRVLMAKRGEKIHGLSRTNPSVP